MKGTFFTNGSCFFFNLKESLKVFCLFVLLCLKGVFIGKSSGLKFPNYLIFVWRFIDTALVVLCSKELESFCPASSKVNFTLLQILL